ncbi:MAG: 1,4-alpha-glucan branching protein domain-containing protein [bacterium]|nr:1,4-alpha-glucan branching protein domain-containing protein [bacterium]
MLHSHLPYARLAGRWPHGEEWIHEAMMETYVPLLETLNNLRDEGIPFRLTFGITPVLAEQLADPLVLDHFDQYLDDRIAAAQNDLEYYEAPDTAHAQLRELAQWNKHIFEKVKAAFQIRFERDVIGAFRRLQDEGLIEISASAATHAYLPLLGRDSSINAQIRQGIRTYERLFGRAPTAFWLPECGYRPAYITEHGDQRPGLEHFLAVNGIKVFFTETHTITGGDPVGVATGDVVGPYGAIKRRYVLPPGQPVPKRETTTFRPYWVADTLHYAEGAHSGVAAIGRNVRVGQQVWSAEWGYPGDFDYREFYRKSGRTGIQYWRITSNQTPLGEKDFYQPEWALCKVDQHSEHFAHLVGDQLRAYRKHSENSTGIVSANYDTELFGHWWFEGVDWLGKVLRHLVGHPDVQLTTASAYIQEHPPVDVLNLPESSWGAGGTHFVWDNGENHWMWPPIYQAEARMESLANQFSHPTADEESVLKQAARELMLMQSSDWQFLVTTGQAREYAIQRFSQHHERFEKLVAGLESGAPNANLAHEWYELDKLFPDIDFRWYRTYETP